MTRVLIVANDVVGRQMAGPGIRCFEFARQLAAAGHEVTLAAPGTPDLADEPFTITEAAGRMGELAETHDVALVQGFALEQYPVLRRADLRLVVDLYDPFPLALLEQFSAEPMERRETEHAGALGAVRKQLEEGDFFLCASEQQRDYWLGALTLLGRINPLTHGDDRTLRRLIDVAPFGLPADPPAVTGPGPRDLIPGIGPEDLVLLWGGGIYNWFDPLTLIRAVGAAAAGSPEVRLVFLSTTHPNPSVPAMWMLDSARRLSDELQLTDRHVFFNERWVPYGERANWLLQADVGVSTHFDHVETRFAFRTRILDYLWAGLPILCTAGDTLAELVGRSGLGLTVGPEDVVGTTRALQRLLGDADLRKACAERVREEAARLTWDQCAAPFLRYCAEPRRAPDRLAPPPASLASPPAAPPALSAAPPRASERVRQLHLEGRRLEGRARELLRREGPSGLGRAARRWAERRRQRPPD